MAASEEPTVQRRTDRPKFCCKFARRTRHLVAATSHFTFPDNALCATFPPRTFRNATARSAVCCIVIFLAAAADAAHIPLSLSWHVSNGILLGSTKGDV